jgi:hypothetical protein
MPCAGEPVRLLFANGADGASHRPAAGKRHLNGPELRTRRGGASDALASGLAGVVVKQKSAHQTVVWWY